MAIINNIATEIGDVLYIKTDVPLVGLVALQSFVDQTVNETADRIFNKTFRYSVDGVNYTPWVDLTNANLQLVQVQSTDTFYIQYHYQRAGTDTTGNLEFDLVTVDGSYSAPVVGTAYSNSNFSNYFDVNNLCSIAWSVNVLEKLYKKGMLPKYILRDFNSDNTTDRDFIDFWRAITHYFALFVCLARKFQFFYQDENLLLEYLVERGLLICGDTDYQELLYLMSGYYDEVRQRGTRKVFKAKNDVSSAGVKQVDGEYLRLVCYDVLDEFIFNLNHNKHVGWSVGNSSPLYKGLEDRLNVNKYYVDFIDDVQHIHELSIADSSLSYVSIVFDKALEKGEDNSSSFSESDSESFSRSNSESDSDSFAHDYDKVVKILPGNLVGLGKGNDKRIAVNPNIDYEVTFLVKDNSTAANVPTVDPMLSTSIVATGSFAIQVNVGSHLLGGCNWQGSLNTTMNLIASLVSGSSLHFQASWNVATQSFNVTAPLNSGATYNGQQLLLYFTGVSGSLTLNTHLQVPVFNTVSYYQAYSGGVTGSVGVFPTFTFGVDCWDKNDNSISTLNVATLTPSNTFLVSTALNKTNRYYFIRGVLFNKNSYHEYDSNKTYEVDTVVLSGLLYYRARRSVPLNTFPAPSPLYWDALQSIDIQHSLKTNIGRGNNLLLQSGAVKIDPYILSDNASAVGSLYVYNIRVQPLSTRYSKGFVGVTNFLELWNTNNNLTLSEDELNATIRKYLIPMDVTFKNNLIDSEINS